MIAARSHIVFRGRRIAVEEMEEMSACLDDYDFSDVLLRGVDGHYYLRQTRMLKMPPNASDLFTERMLALGRLSDADPREIKRLRDWRLRLVKPRVKIKRIKEKTALLWCVHQFFNDGYIKTRLRAVVTKGAA